MKVPINIPTKLSDIKLSQYQKFIKTTKDSEDENFLSRQLVGIFCDLPDSVVGQLKTKDYNHIVNTVSELLTKKPEFQPTFKLNNIEYGFIPNLEDITVNEKADLDTFFKDVDKMDKAMAVLYRPITMKNKSSYLIEDYKAKGDSLNVTLDIAFGANVFFLNLMTGLLNYIQNSIKTEVAHNPKISQILEKNGDGTTVFMNSLDQTFLNLRMSGNLGYMRH